MFFLFAIGIVIGVFFLLTLQKCLNSVSPANRAMQPAMVWLNLIPIFGLFWMIFTALKIAESVVKEGQARNVDVGDGGKVIGLLFPILGICGVIPILGLLCSVGSVVCWILYWVKVAGFTKTFAAPAGAPVAPVA